jgi:hypothetical protein
MARASWGSTTGDFSGLFVGLLDEERRRIESSVQRDIQRSEEQQNAEDNDAYDKWQNGLISDKEWLDYIEGRVRETRGDPDVHETWLKTLREHRSAIHDAQMEQRYEAGHLSIHKLIAYYSGKMEGVEHNSPIYRDTQARYFQLLDTRDSYYIEDEANRILNRIQTGKAGYGELRDFYQGMLKRVRKTSPLYRTLKSNLQNIANVTGSGGGGGSSSGGGSSRSSGGSSSGGSYGGSGGGNGDRDPYSVATRRVMNLWTSGHVFSPGGKPLVESVIDAYHMDTKSDTTVWNALAEDSVVIEGLMEQASDNPNAKELVTPFGQRIPNTLKNRQLLMNQGLRGYDYRIALGNAQGRSILGVVSARASFVDNTFKPFNDAQADDYWKQIRQDFWERSELASQNPNPWAALSEYEEAGIAWEKQVHSILGDKFVRSKDAGRGTSGGRAIEGSVNEEKAVPPSQTWKRQSRFPEEQFTPEFIDDLNYTLEIADFFKNSKRMTPEELQTQASMLHDTRPESYFITSEQLDAMTGSGVITRDPTSLDTTPTVGTGVIGKSYAKNGLLVNEEIQRTGKSYGIPYTFVAGPGGVPMAVPRDSVNDILHVDDWEDPKQTRGGWEKVGGKTEWVIRPLEEVQVPHWYFKEGGKNGQWMTQAEFERFGGNAKAIADAGYKDEPVQELSGWRKVTDGDGKEWFVDPQDNFLYAKPPFQGGFGLLSGPADISAFVNDAHELNMEAFRVPASTGRGFVAWWGNGVSEREAQNLTENIMNNPYDTRIDASIYKRRDDHNVTSMEGLSPDDIVGMYWSAEDAAMSRAREQYWGNYAKYYNNMPDAQRNADIQARAELRRKAEVQSYIDARFQSSRERLDFERRNPTTDLNAVAEREIDRISGLAGISLGNRLKNADNSRLRPDNLADIRTRPAAPPSPKPIAPVPVKPPTVKRRPKPDLSPDFNVYSGPRPNQGGFQP